MKSKTVPIRQCVGCRERKPRVELLRIVKTPEGEVFYDITGKTNGRGLYICRNTDCLMRAINKKILERSYGGAVSLDIYEKLKKELALLDRE